MVSNSREQLTNLKLIEPIFFIFLNQIEELGMVLNEGKIIDASFIEAPRQRNSKEEIKGIKEGKIPVSISNKSRRKSQKTQMQDG